MLNKMKLNPYKNNYDHTIVDCPFCSYFAYIRKVSKVSPDPLRDLKRHIRNAAKNEALDLYIVQESSPTPHLNYYKEHTAERPIVRAITKRQFDNDLTLN